jgi:molecular chaperone DnaK (HSP70)
MDQAVGNDLGTTFSRIAFTEKEIARITPGRDNTRTVLSVVSDSGKTHSMEVHPLQGLTTEGNETIMQHNTKRKSEVSEYGKT